MQFFMDMYDMGVSGFNYILCQFLGVVVCILFWNLLFYLFSWKIVLVIVVGNIVVVKFLEVMFMMVYLLGEICQEVGLFVGVFNILYGYGYCLGVVFISYDDIKVIFFIGSMCIGVLIVQEVVFCFKKLLLEMGGKNLNIIFVDCDYEKVLKIMLCLFFVNQG